MCVKTNIGSKRVKELKLTVSLLNYPIIRTENFQGFPQELAGNSNIQEQYGKFIRQLRIIKNHTYAKSILNSMSLT